MPCRRRWSRERNGANRGPQLMCAEEERLSCRRRRRGCGPSWAPNMGGIPRRLKVVVMVETAIAAAAACAPAVSDRLSTAPSAEDGAARVAYSDALVVR
jgi:hypothetical protein